MGIYINLDRDEYLENGVSPRQRKVHILRWNPAISGCTEKDFQEDFEWYKDGAPLSSEKWGEIKRLFWTVKDWKNVEYMDLFVMVRVGRGATGIMGCGYLHSYPLQEQREDGSWGRTRFFRLSYLFMQLPDKTGLMTGEDLCNAIPEVDWLHGHSGELMNVENAERLGLYLVDRLKGVDDGEYIKFDDFDEKKYVLNDIMTFMCPELKKRLLEMGANQSPKITDINNLMIYIKDESYDTWQDLESHLALEELNGLMM